MIFRNPRALAFLLLAIGTGLVGYHGEKWYRLPHWSEGEIAQSVELNLQIDLARRGPHLQPTGERLEALRRSIRQEVEAEIRREREEPERWIGLGLVLLVLGSGQLVYALTHRPNPPG